MEEVSPTTALIFGLLIGIVMWISGGLVIEVNKRAADGRLKRSRTAGLRTKATTASDEAWVAGHRAAMRSTIIAGALAMVGGVVCAVFGVLAITDVVTGKVAMIAIGIAAVVSSILLTGFLIFGTVQANRASKLLA